MSEPPELIEACGSAGDLILYLPDDEPRYLSPDLANELLHAIAAALGYDVTEID